MSGTDDFQAFVREAFGGLALQFKLFELRFDAIDKRLDAIDKRLDGIDKRLDGLEAREDGFASELAKTRADIMERIDRLQAHLDSVRQDITVNMGAASAATNSVRNIRTDYENLYDMVMTMHRQQMRLTSQVEELSRKGEAH